MSDDPSWQPLPVSAAGIPNLLISCRFTSQSYNIKITDLANVWSETMERRALVRRGLEEDISIDLTDGADQIRRMLDYVRAAFNPSDAEHGNTSLSLAGSDDGRESLVVHITCIMPKALNLKPLEWPMILAKEPQTAISTALVLPLLQAYQARVREADALISELRGKDSVIAKMVDKLEATGTGLEHIFSSLAGKRKVTKSLAEQRVNGLAPFNEASFRASQKEVAESGTADVGTLLDRVFGGDGLKLPSGPSDQNTLAEWWKKLGGGKDVTLVDRGKAKQALEPPTVASQPQSVEEDEFQVQDTPPGHKRRQAASPSPVPPAPVPRAPVHDDDETTDDDSDDLESGPSTQAKGVGSRIGAIGGQKQAPVPAPRPAVAPVASPKKPVQDDSETASDSDNEDAAGPASSSLAVSSPQPKRAGIGRIGGIGALGGRGKQTADPETTTAPASAHEARGRPRAAKEKQEGEKALNRAASPRETSTERADRKRRELRQEQEARAAAGPAKKKRRF